MRKVTVKGHSIKEEGIAMLIVAIIAIFALMMDKRISSNPIFNVESSVQQYQIAADSDNYVESMQRR